jgi:dihydrodipicolinate reductase
VRACKETYTITRLSRNRAFFANGVLAGIETLAVEADQEAAPRALPRQRK